MRRRVRVWQVLVALRTNQLWMHHALAYRCEVLVLVPVKHDGLALFLDLDVVNTGLGIARGLRNGLRDAAFHIVRGSDLKPPFSARKCRVVRRACGVLFEDACCDELYVVSRTWCQCQPYVRLTAARMWMKL